MKIIKKLACMLLVAVMAASIMLPVVSASDGYYHGAVEQTTVWTPQSDNGQYTLHRIPGMVVSNKGTVLIYCEARNTNVKGTQGLGGDWCLMDVYVQRSTDGGKTFGAPIYICKGDLNSYATVNNPVMIVGQDNTLHMLFCKDYSVGGGGLWYTRSTDDGVSWSTPRQLTNYTTRIQHDAFAFGPTHGICTSAGLLMAPVWYVPKGAGSSLTAHGPAKSTVMYSEDNGETWKLADDDNQLTRGAEQCIAELSDGSIMLNGRSSPNRYISVSRTPLGRFTYQQTDATLIDPGCCGGMAVADVEGLPRALIYAGCASTSYRENVTVYCSFDDGWTWEGTTVSLTEVTNDNTSGGYVETYVDNRNGTIYVLYEKHGGKTVHLAKLSFADEFCTGLAAPNISNQILFDNKYSLDCIESSRGLDSSFTGDSMRIETENVTTIKKMTLDMAFISKHVTAETYPYMVAKVKVDAASDADALLSAYFITGREQNAADAMKAVKTVSKDGQWYNVVFDMSETSAKGILHSVELRLAGENAAKNASVMLDIGGIAFCRTEEKAKNYVFAAASTEQDTTAATEAPTEAPTQDGAENTAAAEEKKGCGASLTSLSTALLVGTLIGSTAASKKRKQKRV